jgi:hypothetical protein
MSVRKKGWHSGREDFDISRLDLHAGALTLERLDAKRLTRYLGKGGRSQESGDEKTYDAVWPIRMVGSRFASEEVRRITVSARRLRLRLSGCG